MKPIFFAIAGLQVFGCNLSQRQSALQNNGQLTSEGPFVVAIERREGGQYTPSCTGVVLNHRQVLTAAHCLVDELPDFLLLCHDGSEHGRIVNPNIPEGDALDEVPFPESGSDIALPMWGAPPKRYLPRPMRVSGVDLRPPGLAGDEPECEAQSPRRLTSDYSKFRVLTSTGREHIPVRIDLPISYRVFSIKRNSDFDIAVLTFGDGVDLGPGVTVASSGFSPGDPMTMIGYGISTGRHMYDPDKDEIGNDEDLCPLSPRHVVFELDENGDRVFENGRPVRRPLIQGCGEGEEPNPARRNYLESIRPRLRPVDNVDNEKRIATNRILGFLEESTLLYYSEGPSTVVAEPGLQLPAEGDSGGPVFNARDELVATVKAGFFNVSVDDMGDPEIPVDDVGTPIVTAIFVNIRDPLVSSYLQSVSSEGSPPFDWEIDLLTADFARLYQSNYPLCTFESVSHNLVESPRHREFRGTFRISREGQSFEFSMILNPLRLGDGQSENIPRSAMQRIREQCGE